MQVYKIGVELMLLGGFTAAISALGKNLLGINSQVKQLTGSFGGLKAAITGALTAYAGVKTLEFLGKMVKHGNEIVHQQQLMRELGMSQQEVNEATAKSFETSARVQTTTIAENLKHIRELRYAFGDLGKAQAALTQVSQANAVLQNVTGSGSADQVWDFVKSLEIKGATIDPQQFSDYIDKMTKVVSATGGKVTPRQFFSTFKYGRTAMQGWDEDFIMGALPRSIQSMTGGGGSGSGSGGPGNALQSVFAALVQGQMSKTAGAEFSRLGIGTERKIKGSSKDMVDVTGKDLAIKNPYEWVQTVLMPALAAKGITSQTDITAEIGKMFPNRTAGQIMTEFALQGRAREGANSQFEKDIALHKQPMGAEQGFQFLLNNDLNMQMKAFTAQWNSMLEALGAPLVPMAISVMKSFTGAFTWVTQFANAHPTAIKAVAEAVGGLAVGLLVFTGGAMIAAVGVLAGTPALIAAAVTGVVAALATLAAVNWDAIKSGLTSVYEKLTQWYHGFASNVESWLGNPLLHKFTTDEVHDALTKGAVERQTEETKKNSTETDKNTKEIQNLNSLLKGISYSGPGIGSGDGGGLINASYETVSPGSMGTGGGAANPLRMNSPTGTGSTGVPSPGRSASTGDGASRVPGGSSSAGGGAGAGIAHYGNLATGGGDVNAAIAAGAAAAGMDVAHFKAMASIESSLNPTSNWNRSTQYKGLFQIGRSEWRLHGHGNIYNAMDNAMAMASLIKDNAAIFRKRFGRDPTPDEIYLMHQQGAGFYTRGAMTNIGGNPYPGMRGPQNHNSFEHGWSAEVERRAHIFGGAVPPPKSAEVHVHNKTILDGREIANNSMKHIVESGNKSSSGGRLYDRSYTRPISI